MYDQLRLEQRIAIEAPEIPSSNPNLSVSVHAEVALPSAGAVERPVSLGTMPYQPPSPVDSLSPPGLDDSTDPKDLLGPSWRHGDVDFDFSSRCLAALDGVHAPETDSNSSGPGKLFEESEKPGSPVDGRLVVGADPSCMLGEGSSQSVSVSETKEEESPHRHTVSKALKLLF
ncbi:unnamed protein product [Protopolystoma xenopodis]|uniref:Uncharacterized protein n=1 Tax=Protopolystoma xenopodis TaxID=117903 RepID=A0A448X6Z7_9PLAT|nr:unnamed protein product [Protopolystoma xenopodis]